MRKPYEYQKRIIENSKEREFTMVQAACGTGKSLIAGQTAIAKGRPTLIITPKNIMADFKDELISDGVPEENIKVFDIYESHKDGYYEALSAWLREGQKQREEMQKETADEAVVF